MIDKNTGPDLGEKFELQLQAETLGKLQGMGLSEAEAKNILVQEASDKLENLKGDLLSEIENSSNSKENADAAVDQIHSILVEHRNRLSDYMQAQRQTLSMQIEDSQGVQESITKSLFTSVKTIGTFGKDIGVGFIDAIKSPKAAIQYTYAKADGIISDEDLHYKIT